MDELTRRRWDTKHDPAEHNPLDALRAYLDDVDNGRKAKPTHIVVIFHDDEATGWYQGGSLNFFGQVGLLAATQALMLEQGPQG